MTILYFQKSIVAISDYLLSDASLTLDLQGSPQFRSTSTATALMTRATSQTVHGISQEEKQYTMSQRFLDSNTIIQTMQLTTNRFL